MLSTILVYVFALGCLGTLLLGFRKEWKNARIASMVVALLAFLLSLLTALIK